MQDGCADLILHRRDRCIWATHLLAPQPLFLFDDGDDFTVLTIPSQGQRRGRIAIGPDTFACIRARLHQQLHHRNVAAQHCVMQASMLIVAGPVHAHQFWTQRQHASHLRHVSRLHRIGEARNGRSIDKGFELRPALEAIGAGQHALRIVEGEVTRIGVALELTYFSNGS